MKAKMIIPKGFRKLKIGEIIKEEDWFLHLCPMEWIKTSYAGRKIRGFDSVYIRKII